MSVPKVPPKFRMPNLVSASQLNSIPCASLRRILRFAEPVFPVEPAAYGQADSGARSLQLPIALPFKLAAFAFVSDLFVLRGSRSQDRTERGTLRSTDRPIAFLSLQRD